jgi:hypothetical protein
MGVFLIIMVLGLGFVPLLGGITGIVLGILISRRKATNEKTSSK